MPELSRRALLRAAAVLPATGAAGSAAGCSGVPGAAGTLSLRPTVRVAVPWSAGELEAFRRVLNGISSPAYTVEVLPLGDNIAAALGTRIAGRPDVALLPRPGLVAAYREDLEPLPVPLTDPWPYADIWNDLVFHGQQPYGLPFKIAHKSAVWYRTDVFAEYGLEPPRSWGEWRDLNARLRQLGKTPLALAGGDGWALTDFFENVLLGSAPTTYDNLVAPHPPSLWTSAGVQRSLRLLGRMWSQRGALAGGARRALVLQFADAVLEVFTYGRAAMVVAPDFAESVINRFAADHSTVGVFSFPAVDGDSQETVPETHAPPVVVGGDVAVLPKPSSWHARDLVTGLASPSAPLPWIDPGGGRGADSRRGDFRGGFIAANLNTPMTAYSSELRRLAVRLAQAGTKATFRFDLSDRLGTVGSVQGLWSALHEFLETVGDGDEYRVRNAAAVAGERLRDFEKQLLGERDQRSPGE